MTSKRLSVLMVAMVVSSAALPSVVWGQRSGVEIWAATCGNCHLIQPADRYAAKDWDAIGTHMIITARLTDAQAAAVMEFLKAGARRPEGQAAAEGTLVTTAPPRTETARAARLTPEEWAALVKYVRALKEEGT